MTLSEIHQEHLLPTHHTHAGKISWERPVGRGRSCKNSHSSVITSFRRASLLPQSVTPSSTFSGIHNRLRIRDACRACEKIIVFVIPNIYPRKSIEIEAFVRKKVLHSKTDPEEHAGKVTQFGKVSTYSGTRNVIDLMPFPLINWKFFSPRKISWILWLLSWNCCKIRICQMDLLGFPPLTLSFPVCTVYVSTSPLSVVVRPKTG